MIKKGDRPRANPAKQPVAVVEAKQLNTQRDNEQVSETGGAMESPTCHSLPPREGVLLSRLISIFFPAIFYVMFTKGGLVLGKKISRQHTLNSSRNLV